MIDIYVERGMEPDDAEVCSQTVWLGSEVECTRELFSHNFFLPFRRHGILPILLQDVVRKMSKYDDFFVNVMMVEELGLQVPDPNDDIVKEGVVMFLSFAGFGAMPLLGYALIPLCFPSLGPSHLFNIACGVTALTLFIMGAVKSKFSTRGWLHSGLEMLVLGGICAVMAYEIGHLVSSLVGAGDTEGI